MASGQDVFAPIAIDDMFRAAVGVWGIQPDAFWRMTPREFWWLYDARRPPPARIGTSSYTVKDAEASLKKTKTLHGLLEGVTDKDERRRIIREFTMARQE